MQKKISVGFCLNLICGCSNMRYLPYIFKVKESHKVVYLLLRALTSDLICRRDCFSAMSSLKCGKGNNAHYFLPATRMNGLLRRQCTFLPTQTHRVMKSCYKIIVQWKGIHLLLIFIRHARRIMTYVRRPKITLFAHKDFCALNFFSNFLCVLNFGYRTSDMVRSTATKTKLWLVWLH